MKIKFYPFIQTMIEQEEVMEINNGELIFRRIYGANEEFQKFNLNNEIVKMFNLLELENKDLIEFEDFICVDDEYRFNYSTSTLSYQTLSSLLTKTLDFKYNPRAFNDTKTLFFLGDLYKMYEHHYYQEAKDLIKNNKLSLENNKVIINNEEITILLDKYKVIEFNTTNKLYQVVISLLKYEELI